eukprot:3754418-Rhodomonas_salina.1
MALNVSSNTVSCSPTPVFSLTHTRVQPHPAPCTPVFSLTHTRVQSHARPCSPAPRRRRSGRECGEERRRFAGEREEKRRG